MAGRRFLLDTLIGMAAGWAGAKVMDPVTTKLQEMAPEAAKQQEKRVSPGVAYNLAARDLAGRVGVQLSDKEEESVGSVFHYGLALAGGEMYLALRRLTPLDPLTAAGIVTMVLFLGVDETVNPLMGWSAPPTKYPTATHLRGLAGHVSLGAAIMVTAEALSWLVGDTRGR
jgi:hypothetical protein